MLVKMDDNLLIAGILYLIISRCHMADGVQNRKISEAEDGSGTAMQKM